MGKSPINLVGEQEPFIKRYHSIEYYQMKKDCIQYAAS